MTNLPLLHEIPQLIHPSTELSTQIDAIFVDGFARLDSEQLDALNSLNQAFVGTPLAPILSHAITGISQSEYLDSHFLHLAAARSALVGAQHDALLAHACAALERTVPELHPLPEQPQQSPSGQLDLWCESIRHWLMELALSGFANLAVESVFSFQSTLADIQVEPRMARHAVLLNGFIAEILRFFPTKGTPEIPLTRWVDLWSRAFVLAAQPPLPESTLSVSGQFTPLGAQLRQSDVVANLVVYGLLEGSDRTMLVRASLATFKVDVISGPELKSLFAESGPTLLTGLAKQKTIKITDMPLQNTGDLLWQAENAQLGSSYNLGAIVAKLHDELPIHRWTQRPADRHPALIQELIYLDDAQIQDESVQWNGLEFPLALERMADTLDLPLADLSDAQRLIGFLCFDAGEWAIQPLTILPPGKKKGPIQTHGLFVVPKGKKAKPALPQLRERASRLLRKK